MTKIFFTCTAKHSTHMYFYHYSKKESLKRHQEKCGSERKSTGVRSSKRERKPKVFADHYQSSGDEDYEESDDSFDYDDDDRGGNEDTNTEESGQYRGGAGEGTIPTMTMIGAEMRTPILRNQVSIEEGVGKGRFLR